MDFSSLDRRDRLPFLIGHRPHLVIDGAMGTNLFAKGLETGAAPELWNVDHADRIAELHHEMLAAGADIVLTNSFGGTRHRLKLHDAQDRVAELNRAAAGIARAAVDGAGRPAIVAGSMGPTGEIMQPVGALEPGAARAAFAEQAAALAEGGADVIWIETMSSTEEARAAIEGARGTGLPVVCTMTFDTNGRTMMGVTPEQARHFYGGVEGGLAGCGANCGNGFGELVAAVAGMSQAPGTCEPVLIAKANCGIPEFVDGEIRYTGTPEIMATYARLVRDAGATIVGGCCGSTPAHIRAVAEALDGYRPGPVPGLAEIERVLGLNRAKPAEAGEGRDRARRRRRARS